MPRPIDGLHQAGSDRAARIAQMVEQRHLQAELIAAAHQRAERARADRLEDPARSRHGELELPPEKDPRERQGRGRRRRQGEPPPDDGGPSGGRLDVSA